MPGNVAEPFDEFDLFGNSHQLDRSGLVEAAPHNGDLDAISFPDNDTGRRRTTATLEEAGGTGHCGGAAHGHVATWCVADNYNQAVEIASLPDMIRGVDTVKLANVERCRRSTSDAMTPFVSRAG